MKTYLKYILAPTAIAIALTGCFDLASPASDADESIQATVAASSARDIGVSSTGCKFTDRRTVQMLHSAEGVIVKIGMDPETRKINYAIHVPKNNQRYMTCDLPAEMQKDGVPVIFGGAEKEIFPHERWMATPFELNDIRLNVIRRNDTQRD